MKEKNAESNLTVIEGRNAVLEAFRSGKTIDKLYVLDGCQDGPIRTIIREAKKQMRSLILSAKRGLHSFRRRESTRALWLMRQHTNIQK